MALIGNTQFRLFENLTKGQFTKVWTVYEPRRERVVPWANYGDPSSSTLKQEGKECFLGWGNGDQLIEVGGSEKQE